MKKRIEEILKVQEPMILDLNEYIYFLRECKERIDEPHILFKNYAVHMLHHNIWQLTILGLYKLIKDKENSIQALNTIINQDRSLDVTILSKLRMSSKEINSRYKRNGINEIRNEYVAHLQTNRKKHQCKWVEIFELADFIINYHNLARKLVGMNNAHFIDEGFLVRFIDNTEVIHLIHRLRIEKSKLGENSLSFSEWNSLVNDMNTGKINRKKQYQGEFRV